MKNKLNKILLIISAVVAVLILILAVLGSVNRTGYLSDFSLNINKTLEINGLDKNEIKQLFTIDNKLDNTAITNYIFTNISMTNYSYNFRIRYYSKIFRNSDVYGAYIDTNKLIQDNNFIKEIKMDGNGSPFGNLISIKIIDFEKIDNINYILKLKYNFVFICILLILLLILYACFIYRNNIYKFLVKINNILIKNKLLISRICFIIIAVLIVLVIILALLGKKERAGYLSEFKLNESLSKKNEYHYDFRIKYYSKIFRNSDLYGVYFEIPQSVNINNIQIELKNIKIDKDGSPFGSFISDKELKYDDKINYINYTLKLKLPIYIISIILMTLFVVALFVDIRKIKEFILKENEMVLTYKNSNKYLNILFILYLIFISIYLLSVGYVRPITTDEFLLTSTYNFFYNIFYFSGSFWQRGRHFADIFMGLYMRPFGEFAVSLGIEPIMAQKAFQSIFYALYFYTFFISASLLVWILNNKNNYKLIFVIISIFIIYISRIDKSSSDSYYLTMINVSAYIVTAGLSLLIFYPMIYYFLYKKEIVLLPNRELYYSIYFFFIYVATFTIEPSSLTVAGLSFFILFKLLYDRFLSPKKEQLNFYIILSLIFFIVFSAIAFILTAFFSGRGKWQFRIIDDIQISVIENFIIYFINKFSVLEKSIFIFGIILLIFFIIFSIKNKKISKKQYMYISFLSVGIIGIIGFSMIQVYKNWIEIVLIFIVILSILLTYGKKKNILALLNNLIVINLLIFMSFNLLYRYDSFFKNYDEYKKAEINLVNIYKDAESKGFEEIVLTEDEVYDKGFHLFHGLSNTGYWMYHYGYTSKVIKIKIVKNK